MTCLPQNKEENIMKNTTKAIDTVMFNLVTFREDMKDLPRETVCDHIENYRKLIKELPLKRDQYAANAMLNATIKKMIQCDLTLAYDYAGGRFAVYNQPVPGMSTTEELHALNLKQDVWDSMPRVVVWVESGKIYGDNF